MVLLPTVFETVMSANSITLAKLVELTGIEPVIPQCHCGVIPLHHSPIGKKYTI